MRTPYIICTYEILIHTQSVVPMCVCVNNVNYIIFARDFFPFHVYNMLMCPQRQAAVASVSVKLFYEYAYRACVVWTAAAYRPCRR